MCHTIKSLNHVIFTENQTVFLELNSIQRTTPWYICWFSDESEHKFRGSININGKKYDNIHGTIYVDDNSYDLSYDIFGKDLGSVVNYKTHAALVDGQNTLFSYENLNFLFV